MVAPELSQAMIDAHLDAVRKLGVDDVAALGPRHDDLLIDQQASKGGCVMDTMKLRRSAASIAGAGFSGWSIEMTKAANEIDKLRRALLEV